MVLYRVAENAPAALERSLLRDTGSKIVTYDMKLGVKDKGKLDIRLRFTDGKPEVVQVKKDENKVLIFDVMCLNRYDCQTPFNNRFNCYTLLLPGSTI